MDRILVVEDDQRLAEHIGGIMRTAGLHPHFVYRLNELEADLIEKPAPQAVILDRLLGGSDTKTRVAEIKKRWPSTPILVLSAINTPLERAELLNLGVDDYLGKPFVSQELLARIRALTRRFTGLHADYREIGDLVLDIPKRLLIKGDLQEQLPGKEFAVLRLLSEEIGRIFSKSDLLEIVWGGSLDVETNVVESTIANLRRRIDGLSSRSIIRNSRNLGYWIEE